MKRQSGPFMTIIFACAAVLVAVIAPLPAAHAQNNPIRLVALGDSLSAGYNLPQEAAFPVALERALKAKGYRVEVANAGVSGDTSSGGLDRLDWSVPDGTDGVILELGANDMLRGLDPAGTRKNVEAIVERLKSRNIPVMLAGMYASRNLGPEYVQRFDSIYPDIAKKHDLVLYPFFLDGVAGDRSLNLPDGMHPTAKGVEIIVERILPSVESFLARLSQR
ncbi:arylesterase [Microvirga tunisiensis]|jgi:acyl-CoA thioesterase-1|uniref:Arylesterase n=1 Tax=Microvirga tunisiensis TaxID=2108360 RepID=A0A5N7MC73_9HYPH|nr:arylesterase [Microvirga tunisiensis]MPR06332.1 arylesterase [Microvirga tunisiensis]MPR24455.1 arylesterase [Microvirga tunisiensis]